MTMTILTVLQVLLAIAMIAIILVQRGPGAAAGSGFGAGASATVFGARGSGSFLTRTTAILATVFFALSLLMAVLVSRTIQPSTEVDLGVMSGDSAPAVQDEVPAAPALESLDAADVPVVPGEVPAADDVPALPEATGQEQGEENDGGS